METAGPIFYLPTVTTEFVSKKAGGGSKKPLVPVTWELRNGLAAQLETVSGQISAHPVSARYGAPMVVDLQDEALSKSNRPYALLEKADLSPVAVERRGQMVSHANVSNVEGLKQLILYGDVQKDLYDISTLVSFRQWDPLVDPITSFESGVLETTLNEAVERGRLLRLELFPWFSTDLELENIMESVIGQVLAAYGIEVVTVVAHRGRSALYIRLKDLEVVKLLTGIPGVRSIIPVPMYSSFSSMNAKGFRTLQQHTPKVPSLPSSELPVVGIFDSGIDPILGNWIHGDGRYDVGQDLDTNHGTFVAGLVVGSKHWNGGRAEFPDDVARVFDAQVLPKGVVSEDQLIERIRETLEQNRDNGIRVWNCSFNAIEAADPVGYGTFAQELDLLAKKYDVLIVQSAGNRESSRTSWPPLIANPTDDLITAPAESVRSLTVGSSAHNDSMVPQGKVSSYSRCGPGFGGQLKPDVTFWSGDFDNMAQLSGAGIMSIGANNSYLEGVGTSFSTPIVSAISANIWNILENSDSVNQVTSELVKGLVLHSAMLSGDKIADDLRPYFGAGIPRPSGLIPMPFG